MASSSTIAAQIRECQKDLSELIKDKKQIEEAINNVNSAKSDFDSINAAASFGWIVDNMNTYWSAAGEAREGIANMLSNIITEIGDGGSINSTVSSVVSKAGEKIQELTNSIEEIRARIIALEREYLAAKKAENAE